MANYQIGNNLWGSDNGNYYNYQNNKWTQMNNSPYNTDQSQINNMYGAQQKQQLGALQQQQNQAMKGYNQQVKNNAVTYQGQRNAADVTNAQNVQRMREAMAANGIQASGENVTAQAGLAAQRQSSLNDLYTQQNKANQDAYSQIANIMDPMQKQNIVNTIAAQKAQALHDAYNQYLTRLDQQRAAYISQMQNDRSFNEGKREFDLGQKQNQGQYDSTQAYNYWLAKQGLAQNAGANGSAFQSSAGGGDTTAGPASFQKNLAAANAKGLSKADNADLSWIISHESTFNPNAKNSKGTAYGYGQLIKSNQEYYAKKMGLNYSNPVDQILMADQYAKDRYGSVANAKKFWQQHGWY